MRFELDDIRLIATTFLHRDVIGDTEGSESADSLSFGLSLLAKREKSDRMVVFLRAIVDRWDDMRATMIYSGHFTLHDQQGQSEEEVTHAFQFFAARIAPTVLYPYIREGLAGLAQKGKNRHPHLPVVNFSGLFDPNDVDLTGGSSNEFLRNHVEPELG